MITVIPKRKIQLHFRRFEFKYLISYRKYRQICKLLKNRLKPDPFAGKSGVYTVTSLYFDSPGLKYYRQNEAGLKNRQKIRHRYYNHQPQDTFWEIKRKDDVIVTKDRCLLTKTSSEMYKKMRYYQLIDRLLPTAWIEYQREPWILPYNDLRVTFDFDILISHAHARTQYPEFFDKKLYSGYIIMEIKFSGKLPYWIHRLIQQYSLDRKTLGKYQFAIPNLTDK